MEDDYITPIEDADAWTVELESSAIEEYVDGLESDYAEWYEDIRRDLNRDEVSDDNYY